MVIENWGGWALWKLWGDYTLLALRKREKVLKIKKLVLLFSSTLALSIYLESKWYIGIIASKWSQQGKKVWYCFVLKIIIKRSGYWWFDWCWFLKVLMSWCQKDNVLWSPPKISTLYKICFYWATKKFAKS